MVRALSCEYYDRPPPERWLHETIGRRRSNHAFVREFLLRAVAATFEVDTTLLLLPTRGSAATARARQVAMYLAHVGCRLSLTEVGRLFRCDRRTVVHACRVVEEWHEDRSFDKAVGYLESRVRLVGLVEFRQCTA